MSFEVFYRSPEAKRNCSLATDLAQKTVAHSLSRRRSLEPSIRVRNLAKYDIRMAIQIMRKKLKDCLDSNETCSHYEVARKNDAAHGIFQITCSIEVALSDQCPRLRAIKRVLYPQISLMFSRSLNLSQDVEGERNDEDRRPGLFYCSFGGAMISR